MPPDRALRQRRYVSASGEVRRGSEPPSPRWDSGHSKMRPALGPDEDIRNSSVNAQSGGAERSIYDRCAHLVAHGR